MQRTLFSERLILSAVTYASQDLYRALLGDASVAKYLPLSRPYSHNEAQQELHNSIQHWSKGFGTYSLALNHRPNDPIGYVGIETCPNPSFSDIRFALKPAVQRKGLAKEASKTVLDEYFACYPGSKVVGVALISNVASKDLLFSLGFTLDPVATPYSSKEGLTILSLAS